MATVTSLGIRLRAEIGDMGRSFVESFTGDGIANIFHMTEAPVQGSTLLVTVDGTNVSNSITVEEGFGSIIFDTPPADGTIITASGTFYRYFTDSDINYYINTAFAEHARTTTDSNGSVVNMNTLPLVDEYPLVILASTLALYTLATDSAFDIDIISPDGVSIPRSERYRQLMEMVQTRQAQYRELCAMLGVGLYRPEVYTLRRVSRLTNRYVPIYRPQEVDDGSLPQRVILPIPNYGDVTPASPVPTRDLSLYAGDDFAEKVRFSMDLQGYGPLAQIRMYPDIPGGRVGPAIIATFTITKEASNTNTNLPADTLDTLCLALAGSVTRDLPNVSYYDLQMTDPSGKTKTYLTGKVFTRAQVSIPLGPQ